MELLDNGTKFLFALNADIKRVLMDSGSALTSVNRYDFVLFFSICSNRWLKNI